MALAYKNTRSIGHPLPLNAPLLTRSAVLPRTDYQGPPLTNLVDIINHVKPTALLGLSTIRVSISLFSLCPPW
jgi:hypothetical protein